MNQLNLGTIKIEGIWNTFIDKSGATIKTLYVGNIAIAAYRFRTNYYLVANIITGNIRKIPSENKAREYCEYILREFIKDIQSND